MADSFAKQITPARDIIPVTLDAAFGTGIVAKSLWIGTAGDITIVTEAGETRGPITVPAGLFPVRCTQVNTTATSAATGIHYMV